MTGLEPQTYGLRSDRSTNWATTTAHELNFYISYLGTKQELDPMTKFMLRFLAI